MDQRPSNRRIWEDGRYDLPVQQITMADITKHDLKYHEDFEDRAEFTAYLNHQHALWTIVATGDPNHESISPEAWQYRGMRFPLGRRHHFDVYIAAKEHGLDTSRAEELCALGLAGDFIAVSNARDRKQGRQSIPGPDDEPPRIDKDDDKDCLWDDTTHIMENVMEETVTSQNLMSPNSHQVCCGPKISQCRRHMAVAILPTVNEENIEPVNFGGMSFSIREDNAASGHISTIQYASPRGLTRSYGTFNLNNLTGPTSSPSRIKVDDAASFRSSMSLRRVTSKLKRLFGR